MASRELIALNETTPQLLAPQTGDNYLAPRKLLVTPEVNTNALAVTGYSLTGSNASSLLDLSGTWNTSGTPTLIKANVTNTASNAASKLLDLQVGGSSKFYVSLDGTPYLGGDQYAYVSSQSGWNSINGQQGVYIGAGANAPGNSAIAAVTSNGLQVQSTSKFGFTSGNAIQALDTILARDAANTLAQRNGTAAQAFNLYNTYTDASNYERGFIRYSSNVLQIGHEGLGTGSNARTIAFRTQGFNTLTLDGSNAIFGVNVVLTGASIDGINNIVSQAGYTEQIEMAAPAAPAANRVRIYAVDNGAGKTQLMALFASGAAQQLAVEP